MKVIIYNIFFRSIYYFLNFINPIIKIRLLQIETYAIGHMSQPLEIHLNEKKLNIIDKNLFDIYFPTKEVCNLFLWHKYRKVMNIIMPDKILRFIFEPIFRIALKKNNQNMLIPFRHHANNLAKKNINIIWQAQDVNGVLEKTDPTISFTKDEENKGYDFFKKNNIFENDKIILLISRDPKYRHLNSNGKVGLNYTYRDQDVNIFKEAVEHLCSLNYKVIRMGRDMEKKLDVQHPNFFDYAFSNQRSDFLDIFLIKACYFAISTGTGLDNVCSLFRKKILLINHGDLILMNYLNKNISLFYPKRFFYLSNNEELNILDIQKKISENSDITEGQEFLKKLNIGYKNIDSNKIKNACVEMIDYLENGPGLEAIELNKKINDQFLNKYNLHFKINFCKSYLKS